ncbi:hypothetical protein Mgra_00001688 [Meloidogyne graminicola]|uniref:Dynein light chain n=1 Tax=Meloidogyne graminicola TaxID=189291 RepID=A0A8T0A0P9_9BILA|nr:hypothetical protein Mgra_00001688 [Meloidogyne graminicola]
MFTGSITIKATILSSYKTLFQFTCYLPLCVCSIASRFPSTMSVLNGRVIIEHNAHNAPAGTANFAHQVIAEAVKKYGSMHDSLKAMEEIGKFVKTSLVAKYGCDWQCNVNFSRTGVCSISQGDSYSLLVRVDFFNVIIWK